MQIIFNSYYKYIKIYFLYTKIIKYFKKKRGFMKKHIEVIATDIDDLAMMGFGSVENCKSVFNCLKKYYINTNFNIVRNKEDLEEIVSKKPDLVFSGIKYIPFDKTESSKTLQKKIWISEYMEQANINYVGSSKKTIELEFDKSLAKKEVLKCCISKYI